MTDKEKFMKEAVNAALKGMNNNEGGPFGCVIVKDGQIVVGNTMKLTLACDHRSVDGATGSKFLQALQQYIENPITMLL